jgi:hypothetical protein
MAIHVVLKTGFQGSEQFFALFWRQLFFCFNGFHVDFLFVQSSGRPFRYKSSQKMAFPHPQPCHHHYRKEDKPGCGGIVRKSFKRAIDIAEYRNGKDDVNPAKNQTCGARVHDVLISPFNAGVIPTRR